MITNLDSMTKAELEALYRCLLSTLVQVCRLLGKPCPVQTRAERRQNRVDVVQ